MTVWYLKEVTRLTENTPIVEFSPQQWKSVYKLAQMWNFTTVLQALQKARTRIFADKSDTERIQLYRDMELDIDGDYVGILHSLVSRRAGLDDNEIQVLGLDVVKRIYWLRGRSSTARESDVEVSKRICELWGIPMSVLSGKFPEHLLKRSIPSARSTYQ